MRKLTSQERKMVRNTIMIIIFIIAYFAFRKYTDASIHVATFLFVTIAITFMFGSSLIYYFKYTEDYFIEILDGTRGSLLNLEPINAGLFNMYRVGAYHLGVKMPGSESLVLVPKKGEYEYRFGKTLLINAYSKPITLQRLFPPLASLIQRMNLPTENIRICLDRTLSPEKLEFLKDKMNDEELKEYLSKDDTSGVVNELMALTNYLSNEQSGIIENKNELIQKVTENLELVKKSLETEKIIVRDKDK